MQRANEQSSSAKPQEFVKTPIKIGRDEPAPDYFGKPLPLPRLSIVAPCYNEEAGILEFYRRVSAVAKNVVGEDYELILVNDGSQDRTWALCKQLLENDAQLVLVNLSRRYGHQLALSAGFELCRGDRIVSIDSDMQDPPELLFDMWQIMERDRVDVVYGQRRERRGETLVKRGTATSFYWLLRRIGYADIPANSGDFRMMTRRVVNILNGMPEQHRFIRGMISWIGLRQVPITYDRDPRIAGSSNYSLARMVGLAFDGLTSFSILPLRIASYIGLVLSAVSLAMLTYTLGSWAFGHVVDGWTSLSTIVLVIGSAQLMLFGVMGEYIGRLYIESKGRPLYVIDEIEIGLTSESGNKGIPANSLADVVYKGVTNDCAGALNH